MPQYRALRDFGSHLGNHLRGEILSLPDGPLPRGFAGLVERLPDPAPAVTPARTDVPPAAAPSPPRDGAPVADAAAPPSAEAAPSHAADASAGYADKMLRPKADRP